MRIGRLSVRMLISPPPTEVKGGCHFHFSFFDFNSLEFPKRHEEYGNRHSLVVQALHGVELGGAGGRDGAEDDAHQR